MTLANAIRGAIQGKALLVINDRVDIAQIAGASGVQLGEDGLPVVSARALLGQEYLIGRSVHTMAGAGLAEVQGADFLVAGTMYATRSHPGSAPAGPALVRQMAENCQLPIVGIGGITPENLGTVIEAGASGVAVISSILASDQPRRAAEELKQALIEAVSALDNRHIIRETGRSGAPAGGNDQV